MIALIAEKKDRIAEHCRRLNVKRLEVFGSAARGDFDPEKSDIDFLVEFGKNTKVCIKGTISVSFVKSLWQRRKR